MKEYTFFFVCCLASLIGAESIYAQGFNGPGSNPSPLPVPEVNPPSPPSPPPGLSVNPPPLF